LSHRYGEIAKSRTWHGALYYANRIRRQSGMITRKKEAARARSIHLSSIISSVLSNVRDTANGLKCHRNLLFGAILVGVTVLTYQPAWNGKPLLDDADHLITDPKLRSLSGLISLWIAPPPTHQYHPLLDTLFWIGDKLWGESMLGYHLVSISLHAVSALLLLRILRRLEVPGAWFAAAIFALHPVQVESVAWVVELKNTLSGVFFFGCILTYLNFDQNQNRIRSYVVVLVLFLLGMMAKPILATLPAVILIVLWWKRGKLEWKRDVQPLVPFIVLGIVAGLLSVWMEREFSGSQREITELSLTQRLLVAGRAFWFYLGKIFWPSKLSFMYPRWKVNPSEWWQYLFPIAALFVLAVAWRLRGRWRAPLAGLLFFVATLLPLLGFFNVSFFRFSFVADHFQYLPIVGIITPVSAGAVLLLNRFGRWQQMLGYGFCGALLITLTGLSWMQSRVFRDYATCFRAVVERNPSSWAAHINLGFEALSRRSWDEAAAHFHKVLETNPDHPPAAKRAYLALSGILLTTGHTDEAITDLEKALQIDPNYAEAHGNLGNAFLRKGRTRDAIAEYRRGLEIAPRSALIQSNLAWVLATSSDPTLRNGAEAVLLALQAESLSGGTNPKILRALAAAYAERGQFAEASKAARRAREVARERGETALAQLLENDIAQYDAGYPYREGSH
jgi:protein O-mannosyl-transferase